MNQYYQQCSRCVLDTTATFISFDQDGVCNHCHNYDKIAKKYVLIDEKEKKRGLDEIVALIKRYGKNKKYDCIIGLSGGVDSTYLAYLAKDLGLRPLAVHSDNGWNSELAVNNIYNIVNKLNLDLETGVINWDEFKDIQLAYLKASVVDIEIPSEQYIYGAIHEVAAKKNIKFILNGYNFVTEYGMPKGWTVDNKMDFVNLKNIHKKFGTMPMVHFPNLGFYKRFYYNKILGISSVSLLNYIPYVKKDIKKFIHDHLDWKDYGGKHYESIYTRFYQGHILPVKFNIDKRKTHLSTLICSGQITRVEALAELESDPYPFEQQMADKEYIIKKLNITAEEFEKIMKLPRVEHEIYGSEASYNKQYEFLNRISSYPVTLLTRSRNLWHRLR